MSAPAVSEASAPIVQPTFPVAPYAYYPLTTDASDNSGNGRTLSITGTPTFDAVAGATFDGWSYLSAASPFLDTAGDRSFALWVKAAFGTTGGHGRLIRKGGDSGGDGITLYSEPHTGDSNTGNVGVAVYIPGDIGGTVKPNVTPFDDTWHFLKVRYTLATSTLEIGVDDGEMVSQATFIPMADSTGDFSIAGEDYPFTGQIKNVYLYDRALSNIEFNQIFAAGA